jgi:hypothetical protein
MSSNAMIERLKCTADQCRNQAQTASDPEAANTLIQLAAEMEAVIAMLQVNVGKSTSETD